MKGETDLQLFFALRPGNRHHDQQIHVAMRTSAAARVGAKEYDVLRIEPVPILRTIWSI